MAKKKKTSVAKPRGSWYGVNPCTKVVKSKKVYDRKKFKKVSEYA